MGTEAQSQQLMQDLVAKIEAAPNDWPAYVDLVNLLTVTENLVEAEELGLKSLGLFATDAVAQEHLALAVGSTYYTAGDYAQATTFFQKISAPALQHEATMMQAQTHYAAKEYQRALAFALTGVEQDPQDLAALTLLGQIWLALGELPAATQAFEQALSLDQQDYAANFGRGLIEATQTPGANVWWDQAATIDAARFAQERQNLADMAQLLKGGHGA